MHRVYYYLPGGGEETELKEEWPGAKVLTF
jgi:hypothetical protein